MSPTATRNSPKTLKELKKSNSSRARLKIVVRRLPPNLPEPVFWQSVDPWVSDETVSWKVFRPGKLRKDVGKENVPSVAYLLFKDEECLATFSKEYDGHNFRDKQGNDSFAVVEFAPNPKVPPEKKKVDPRHATIQQDEDYVSFVASLQNPLEKHEVDMEALLASTVPSEEPKITPLLAALLEQKEQKTAVQDKKILINEIKGSRKAVSTSSSTTAVIAEPPSAGKKGKKGRGKDPTASPPAPPSGKGRNRGGNSAASKEKEIIQQGPIELPPKKEKEKEKEREKERDRARPVVGLASRHLKVALSGAGVQLPAASTSSSTSVAAPSTSVSAQSPAISSASTSIITTAPSAINANNANTGCPITVGGMELGLPHTNAPAPRGRGEGRGKKRSQEPKDGPKEGVRGGGGGREKKTQARPPSASASGHGTMDVPFPRILSRQDPAATAINASIVNSNESSAKSEGNLETARPTSGRGGGHRGRGVRRERERGLGT